MKKKSYGKTLQVFLTDGTADGIIKCTLTNWTGLVYKIPRTLLQEAKEIKSLDQSGIYCLFGDNNHTGKPQVYIGQAGQRKNGRGILGRIGEHLNSQKEDWWTTAVALTSTNNNLGSTEISYLENRFYRLAVEAERYALANNNDPSQGNITEEKESEMEEYIEYASLVMATLGYRLFEPLRQATAPGQEQVLFYAKSKVRDVEATGARTSEGFVVFAGSRLSTKLLPSCSPSIAKKRETYQSIINQDRLLTEDLLFNSPSTASSFVLGASSNGHDDWKTEEGLSLKEWERQQQQSLIDDQKNKPCPAKARGRGKKEHKKRQ